MAPAAKSEGTVAVLHTDLPTVTTGSLGQAQQSSGNPRTFQRYKLAYGLSQLVTGAAFAAVTTYVAFQIQIVGFSIGHEPDQPPGTGCPPDAPACRVPFGSQDVNLTSVLLYLQAISYAVSGALTIFIAGVGDRMHFQREQYVMLLAAYGAFALPLAALTGIDVGTFNTLSALYTVFNILGFLTGAWGKVFVPFVMHRAEDEHDNTVRTQADSKQGKRERAGMSLSLWGSNALSIGQIVLFIIVIGLTYTSSLYAGLYMSTAAGALCVVGAVISWPWLPSPQRKAFETKPTVWTWLATPFLTLQELALAIRRYPQAAKWLLANTIYVDSVFGFDSVRGQLFNLVVRPDVRELTAYSMVQPIMAIVSGTVFVLIFPWLERRLKLSLRYCTVVGYIVVIGTLVWAAIGISDSAAIGLHHRWEFYLLNVVRSSADSVLTIAFTVLYAELFPRGREIEYFGFQIVLSCATVWVPQVVNGPIIDATNIIRLPAIISAGTMLVALGLVLWTDEQKGMASVSST